MRDQLLLYSQAATHSDDSLYSAESTADGGSTASGSRESTGRRLRHRRTGDESDANSNASTLLHRAALQTRAKVGQPSQETVPGTFAQDEQVRVGGRLGDSKAPQGPRISHKRSASLLSRFRNAGVSPASSPTPSESSSRDTRSDRTLAHSASSGSVRRAAAQEATAHEQQQHQQRPSVRVLPPEQDAHRLRKRGAPRGDRPGGFISQLLRGPSRSPQHSANAPVARQQQQQQSQEPQQFQQHMDLSAMRHERSPGTPHSQHSAGSASPGSANNGAHFHVSQCHFTAPEDGPESAGSDQGAYCMGGEDDSDMYYSGSESSQTGDDDGAGYGWYGTHDAPETTADITAGLPVYEPIDMDRAGGYAQATRPMLPDARMLAPMASLADAFGAGVSASGALSSRELRFAVENLMLVEQHRFLIRDLGHARAAIGALKQVVQAKDERLDLCEAANAELHQRVAQLEAALAQEQHSHPPSEVAQAEPPAEDDVNTQMVPQLQEPQPQPVSRPLSGYATGFALAERPVHQLPRVFSGDYSADVHAMESSVEALASAITSMPRDTDSVDAIIARTTPEPPEEPTPPEPRRRSRLLSAFRLSSYGGTPGEPVGGTTKHKRRSVSLGSSRPQQPSPDVAQSAGAGSPAAPQQPAVGRTRADSHESLAASCPTLIPGIARTRNTQKPARPASQGRYPTDLGLGDAMAAPAPAPDAAPAPVQDTKERRRRVSHRFSLNPKPRRSTSAPSRPHSMRVSRHRSWLFHLFGGGSSSSTATDTAAEPPSPELGEDIDDSDDFSGMRARRRRVMTHSTSEVSQFLGRLRLEEDGPPRATGLEDVVDVSGEDEERASRPSLSVAEIRQQTLDALNGSQRKRPPLPDELSSPQRRDSAERSTITRLNAPPRAAGLGVSISHRGPPNAPDAPHLLDGGSLGRNRRTQSCIPPAADLSTPSFWTPPPPPLHPSNPAAVVRSPRNSGDSADAASAGRRSIDDRFRSAAGSPWELVRLADSRGFPISPSRSGSPPAQLGFFEDSSVPDSDELTVAARKSLSLRMSHTSFRQAEPLPESDDVDVANIQLGHSELSRPGSSASQFTKNLVTDAQSSARPRTANPTASKRRSLLRQLNPISARVDANVASTNHNEVVSAAPPHHRHSRSESSNVAASIALSRSPALLERKLPTNTQPAAPQPSAGVRRTKKWWSAMLG
ncbi:hypothetical protein H4R20_000178 [Coemansia guatemalensis]|uniref:Uncharacterized protein n=1 Tax=Coemansia guatemalensis TaxID=2761395 RepID=A0A9W8LUE7_9FUNG|nr:hypothetical protein H4R20_000178 [Coemansia guatemalensis]